MRFGHFQGRPRVLEASQEVTVSLEQMYNGHQLQSGVPRLLVCRNCQQSASERCRRCNQRCADELEMRQVSR